MDETRNVLQGLMMDEPLSVSSLIQHADRWHGTTEIVSRMLDRSVHRYSYRDLHRRARQLANCLLARSVKPGERVGTLAWNGYRHLELYFAVSGIGAVCHTINPRLFPEQIAYIINHAEDVEIHFDASFLDLVAAIAPRCPNVRRWVLLADPDDMPSGDAAAALPLSCYEEDINESSDVFTWPVLDERAASSLCYTSGTTGDPKGVLYSHRSTVLHALTLALPDALDCSAQDVVMPVVPMFHVNAWGIPYAAAAIGVPLVLPGAHLDPASLYELFEAERVTRSAGVPTIWNAVLAYLNQTGRRFSSLERVLVGGSALPRSTQRAYAETYDVRLVHAWGMTEVSPLGTVGSPLAKHRSLPEDALLDLLSKQGHVPYGVDMKIVDDAGNDLLHDGEAFGHLMVRGPWVAGAYFQSADRDAFSDGWFRTGDVATIDADGFLQITDRAKDVIKSGGEWISSIALESLAMSHPAVAEAAVVAVEHPKWGERPLLIVVPKPDAQAGEAELLEFFVGKVAKWWIPDAAVFVSELPHTATGKLQKAPLRSRFAGYLRQKAAAAA